MFEVSSVVEQIRYSVLSTVASKKWETNLRSVCLFKEIVLKPSKQIKKKKNNRKIVILTFPPKTLILCTGMRLKLCSVVHWSPY